ncbi:MAG: copper oxidase [Myxococcota bacterium]|nr:copper oxidase [Myxococcota bacterium]
MNRRDFLVGGAVAGATLIARRTAAQHAGHGEPPDDTLGTPPDAERAPEWTQREVSERSPVAAARPDRTPIYPGGPIPVHMPNGTKLRWRRDGDVLVGHLVAGEIDHELAPGLRARLWAYNGRTPGPLIEAVEGDRVRIFVTNRLLEPTTVHWHGMIVPNGMDGVSGLNQRPIPVGATFKYELVLRHAGTFMYHSHHDEMTQIGLGLVGMFVVHPRRPRGPRVDRDFALMTHEWRIEPGTRRADHNEMTDFNVFTFNGKAWPATEPLLVGRGERTRIRFGNLSPMTHHPIHLHGHHFRVTETDGGRIPESAQQPNTTVIVPVGAVRVIEFVSEEPGDWAMHCHMTHHMMMQMGHGIPSTLGVDARVLDPRIRRVIPEYMTMGTRGMAGMGQMTGHSEGMPLPPNSIPMRGGPGPFSYIDMGGMVTIVMVRDDPERADPAAWYRGAPETIATEATAAELRAAQIDPDRADIDD